MGSTHDEATRRYAWRFLSSYALVLILIAEESEITETRLARLAEISPRTVQNIVHDLKEAGYVETTRVGRRNRYMINYDRQFERPGLGRPVSVGELLAGFG